MQQLPTVFRRVLTILLIIGLVLLGNLIVAWLVVMNTDACWWPWSDILNGPEELCSLGR